MSARRAKSNGMLGALQSSISKCSSSASRSSLKRRKLLENTITPSRVSRSLQASSSFTWSRCTSKSSARLELEKRSEEHTSELQSLMRTSYAVFCLQKKTKTEETRTAYT